MPGVLGVAVQGVERTQRRLTAIARQADQMVWEEIDRGANLIQVSARRRAIVVKNTNVQDDTRRRDLTRRTPVRVRRLKSALAAVIVVTSFWTGARSAAIRSLYNKHGLADKLNRRYLWVNPRAGSRRTKKGGRVKTGHPTRDGLAKLAMQGRILAWASGQTVGNRGDQHLTAVIRPPAQVRRDLVLGPAARQHSDTIRQGIASAVERAGRVRG